MFEQFTLRARRVMLGILGDEQSAASAVLKRYGVQRENVMTRMPDSSQEQGPPNPDIALDFWS